MATTTVLPTAVSGRFQVDPSIIAQEELAKAQQKMKEEEQVRKAKEFQQNLLQEEQLMQLQAKTKKAIALAVQEGAMARTTKQEKGALEQTKERTASQEKIEEGRLALEKEKWVIQEEVKQLDVDLKGKELEEYDEKSLAERDLQRLKREEAQARLNLLQAEEMGVGPVSQAAKARLLEVQNRIKRDEEMFEWEKEDREGKKLRGDEEKVKGEKEWKGVESEDIKWTQNAFGEKPAEEEVIALQSFVLKVHEWTDVDVDIAIEKVKDPESQFMSGGETFTPSQLTRARFLNALLRERQLRVKGGK